MVHLGFPGRRQWHPTTVLLPGKSHGWRSLVGCSPWSLKELDTTEQLTHTLGPIHYVAGPGRGENRGRASEHLFSWGRGCCMDFPGPEVNVNRTRACLGMTGLLKWGLAVGSGDLRSSWTPRSSLGAPLRVCTHWPPSVQSLSRVRLFVTP